MSDEFKIDWLTKFSADTIDLGGGITTGGFYMCDECVLGDPAPDVLALSLQLRLDGSWAHGEEIELYLLPRMESSGITHEKLSVGSTVTDADDISNLRANGDLVYVHKNGTDLTAHLENVVTSAFEYRAYSCYLGIYLGGSGAVAADGDGENNVAYIHKGVYQYQSS